MKYEALMAALVGGVHESLPMVSQSYEHLAREYDMEVHAYFDERPVPSATGGVDGTVKSPHILFHRPCFEAIMKITRKLRDPKKFEHAYMIEGMGVIGHVEDHCIQLANQDQHRLSMIHAATNRAVWQGANALMSMALAIRPKSSEWMECVNTWTKGTAAAVTCIAVLRLRRNHPEELLFNEPDRLDVHPMDFANRMMEKQAETAEIIKELFAWKPSEAPV